jgi:acyl phosphate:glycerol-3-phosphate acyltransferase
MTDWTAVLFIVPSFIIGSFPTGYLLTRWLKGTDIRRLGSGNPGATNVFRSVGAGPGLATLLIDMIKGWLPVWAAQHLFAGDLGPTLAGLAAVAGHTWSPFLGFRGGKGVATSAGVFAALTPVATLAALAGFGIGLGISRHVSVGSLTGAAVLPVAAFWRQGPSLPSFLALAVGILVVVRHIPNIRRLLKGEELAAKPAKEKS